MRKAILVLMASLTSVALVSGSGYCHCQIPCGIYDDPMRFAQMEEHVKTIEKSMNEIERISGESDPDWNQLVRWIMNKEDHADQLSEIATYYFLAQRVKPADSTDRAASAEYMRQLRLLHRIVLHAMKAKQTVDLSQCETLRDLIKDFKMAYMKG